MKYIWEVDKSVTGLAETHTKQVTMGSFHWSAEERLIKATVYQLPNSVPQNTTPANFK
jgi:hypothetical protein